MGFNKRMFVVLFVVLFLILVLLLLLLLSFNGLNYYEYGFERRKSTGTVNRDRVFDGGLYATGPDYNFKIFPSDAHYLEFDNIAVFAADRLEVEISALCQYFLRKDQLHYLHKLYDVNYDPVISKNGLDAIKGAATKFTTRQYIHERHNVERDLFKAVKLRLSGTCCEKDCGNGNDTCVEGCKEYSTCSKDDMGLFVEVRYFQLHSLSIPSSLSEKYTQSLVLQEAEEREQFIQDAQLVRKDTERMVAEISNEASEINENGTAYSTLIRAEATAASRAIIEGARKEGLQLLYQTLNITEAAHMASFDYLRTLKHLEGVNIAVNYDSLRLQAAAGSARAKRDVSDEL